MHWLLIAPIRKLSGFLSHNHFLTVVAPIRAARVSKRSVNM